MSASSCGVLMRRNRFARRLASTSSAAGNACSNRITADPQVRAPMAMRRAGPKEAAAQRSMRVRMQADSLTVSAMAQDVGEATEEVSAVYNGEELLIAFNAEYLHDGVEVLDSDEILLLTADSLKPALLQSAETDDPVYVLMPLRVT